MGKRAIESDEAQQIHLENKRLWIRNRRANETAAKRQKGWKVISKNGTQQTSERTQ